MDPADAEKKRSYSTLNTLYHESRQEMELLAKQLAVKDNIIAELKLRRAGHERLCLSVGDNQSVVVGPSKSLLDSLCKEIYKLKQKSNETDLKVVRQEEEIQRLSEQLRQKDEQLESIKCGAKSPGELNGDPEKELELRRLRSAEATRTVLCTSLAEEAEQLRGQLGATVQVCRQLMAKLEKSKAGKAQAGEQAATQPPESPDRSTNSQIRQLEDENRQLKQRVAYVQGLNSQWQKYDSSREDYIRGLCQRLKSVAATPLAPSLASTGAALLHQEISRLNGLLEDKLSECARLRGETQEASSEDRERIQTLEQQVLIYKEDFKSERADRERAQGRIQDLKEQICHLKQQLHRQGSTRETREVPVCHVHIGHRVLSSSSSRRHHRDVGDCSGARNNTPRLLAPSAAVPSPPALPQDAALMEVPSDLQCPRCLATFSEDDVTRYLNHCEECATL